MSDEAGKIESVTPAVEPVVAKAEPTVEVPAKVEPVVAPASEIESDIRGLEAAAKTDEPEKKVEPTAEPVKEEPVAKVEDKAVEIAPLLADFLKQQKEMLAAAAPKPVVEPEKVEPFKFVEFTADDYNAILESPETGIEKLNQFSKDITTKSIQTAWQLVQAATAPLQQYINKLEIQKAETDFAVKYPDLKEDMDVCREIVGKIPKEQFASMSQEQLFDYTAKTARSFLAKYQQRFAPKAPGGGGNGKDVTAPVVPPTASPKPSTRPGGTPAPVSEVEADMVALFNARPSKK